MNEKDRLYQSLGGEAWTSVAERDKADPNLYRWDVILAEA